MAARRALEWIEDLAVLLDMKYQTCFSSRCMLELKFAIYHRAARLHVLTGFLSRGM